MPTTTDDPLEARACQQSGCKSYVVKPVNARHCSDLLHALAVSPSAAARTGAAD